MSRYFARYDATCDTTGHEEVGDEVTERNGVISMSFEDAKAHFAAVDRLAVSPETLEHFGL